MKICSAKPLLTTFLNIENGITLSNDTYQAHRDEHVLRGSPCHQLHQAVKIPARCPSLLHKEEEW
jgi:hypothetical protein